MGILNTRPRYSLYSVDRVWKREEFTRTLGGNDMDMEDVKSFGNHRLTDMTIESKVLTNVTPEMSVERHTISLAFLDLYLP